MTGMILHEKSRYITNILNLEYVVSETNNSWNVNSIKIMFENILMY